MNEAEYKAAVIAAVTCARMLAQHDIPALLEAIDYAESVGPIIDPTLWRNKAKAMSEDRELLLAAGSLRAFSFKMRSA
ncbi:MAG: hypothetical protein A2Y38_17015 [Spirochaetes bacterium GWB1_59_5]|nr:MAG: hypothetical protein A2Y38_17015 [Spirochaetes bacterium GWB1_59_5]